MASGEFDAVLQSALMDEADIKHAPKIFKEDCKIDWNKDTESVRNLIRGLSPYPAAWTKLIHKESGKEIPTKVFLAIKIDSGEEAEAGTIITDGKIVVNVACKNGWLQITDLQIAGKKRMKTQDFLRGFQQIREYRFQ